MRTADTDGLRTNHRRSAEAVQILRAHGSDAALIRQITCINAPPREYLPQTLLSPSWIDGCFCIRRVTCSRMARSGSYKHNHQDLTWHHQLRDIFLWTENVCLRLAAPVEIVFARSQSGAYAVIFAGLPLLTRSNNLISTSPVSGKILVPETTHAKNRKAGPTYKTQPTLDLSQNPFRKVCYRQPRLKTTRRARPFKTLRVKTYHTFRNVHDLSACIPLLHETDAVGSRFLNMALMKRANFMALGTSELSLHKCRCGTYRASSDQRTLDDRKPLCAIASSSSSGETSASTSILERL